MSSKSGLEGHHTKPHQAVRRKPLVKCQAHSLPYLAKKKTFIHEARELTQRTSLRNDRVSSASPSVCHKAFRENCSAVFSEFAVAVDAIGSAVVSGILCCSLDLQFHRSTCDAAHKKADAQHDRAMRKVCHLTQKVPEEELQLCKKQFCQDLYQ